MEELDEEWVHTKEEFEKACITKIPYEAFLTEIYAIIGLFGNLGYETILLVYFVYCYLMNAIYDYLYYSM